MTSDTKKQKVLILGAGVCGLYAALTALRNGLNVTIIEKQPQVGGLATGHQRGENYYDMGVHMLHAFDKEIFKDISSIMGQDRIEVPLDARIRWHHNTYKYPLCFRDLIKEMPLGTLLRGVAGLLFAEFKRGIISSEPANAEEALIAFYGKPLYRFFFENFTHKYWGIHPRDISAEFIKRKMPRLSAVDFIRKSVFSLFPKKVITTESSLDQETLHYSQKGAYLMVKRLADEVRRLGGEIELEAEITTININELCLEYFNTKQEAVTLKPDAILSTIPINSLVSLCPQAPSHVAEAAREIRYKPIAVYGLLINKTKAMDGLYTYFRNRIFHRVGEPKNAGMVIRPSSATLLIVETTCEVGDDKWNAEAELKQRVIDDLQEEGICDAEDIIEWHTFRNAHGYPVYAKGYEQPLEVVLEWMGQHPLLISTGRQGGFTYPTMHKAMRMGADSMNTLTRLIDGK